MYAINGQSQEPKSDFEIWFQKIKKNKKKILISINR